MGNNRRTMYTMAEMDTSGHDLHVSLTSTYFGFSLRTADTILLLQG